MTGSEHIRAFRSTKVFQIACIASRSKNLAEEKSEEFKVPAATSLKEMFEKYTPDILVICVPPDAVMKVMEDAIIYPWQILIEKPAGVNLQESKEMLHMVEKHSDIKKIWVGMNRRMLPSTLTGKKLIENSTVNPGSELEITITDQQDKKSAEDFGHSKLVIENWHFANSIHLMDLALSFAKSSPNVADIRKERFGDGEIVEAKLHDFEGNIIHYKAYWNMPAPWAIQVVTKRGWIQQTPIEKIRSLFEEHITHDLSNSIFSEPIDIKPGFFNQALALSGMHPQLEKHLCDLSESHTAMSILDKIYEN